MKMKVCTLVFLISYLHIHLLAQSIPIAQKLPGTHLPQINYVFNRVANGNIDAFYKKLAAIRNTGKGSVTIVHIGDSHIQADMLTGVVRADLQQTFGNAGRGLVFPYQLAKSNTPIDISSTSNTSWQYNRLAHSEIDNAEGISGFYIRSRVTGAAINVSLKPTDKGLQTFKRLKLFTENDSLSKWKLTAENNDSTYIIQYSPADTSLYKEIILDSSAGKFSLSSLSTGNMQSFYGVSLEKDTPGVIYSAIGVNGAKYEQYNSTPLFWQQLPALNADLYIVSLGTNEAQASFNEADFSNNVNLFIQNLQKVSPGASVLITTAGDSYKGNTPNRDLKQLNLFLEKYSRENNIALWDLYKITNGHGSAKNWFKKGLLNKDRIHFTAPGYRIQAELLYMALIKGFNGYMNN